MRHQKAHRKLGRTKKDRMSLLRNRAVSLINSRGERLVTTPKAKELRPFVEREITLSSQSQQSRGREFRTARVAPTLPGSGIFSRRQHDARALSGERGQVLLPRTAGVAALKRFFD